MNHVPTKKDTEIDRNLERFLELLPSLMAEHSGQYALLRDCEIIHFYPSAIDAQIAGNQAYPDHLFSIQQVEEEAKDLGYYSYALYPG